MSRNKKKQLPVLEKITITSCAAEGKSLARVDEKVVFVPFVVPGDVVDLQVKKKKSSYMEAVAVRFHDYSPLRTEPVCKHYGVCGGCKWQCLKYEEQLKAKVAELGAQISRDYAGKNLVLVSILKGSVVFMADLMRAVSIPCNIDFMVVSSYGGSNTTTSGLVKIIKDLDGDLSGKDVLIVEDILDTGVTLSNLVPMLKMRNPNSVKICTILDKPSRRKADIQPDYEGFQVPDEFVVGYGLDYDEKYRNLPYVGVLKPEVYTK